MSSNRCACPSCRRPFRVPDDVLGKLSRCPGCGAGLILRVISGQTTVSLARPLTLASAPESAAASAFDFAPPVARAAGRRGSVRAGRVPLWGTFFVVLTALLIGLGWGGWHLYDVQVRQPRYQAIRKLHRDWKNLSDDPKLARQLDDIARQRYGVPAKDLPRLLPD